MTPPMWLLAGVVIGIVWVILALVVLTLLAARGDHRGQ